MSEFVVSDGWSSGVPIPHIDTGTEALDDQLKMIGRMYNITDSVMMPEDKAHMDGLIHWLTEIQIQFKESDIVVLQEKGE